jgi:hypothetical protein
MVWRQWGRPIKCIGCGKRSKASFGGRILGFFIVLGMPTLLAGSLALTSILSRFLVFIVLVFAFSFARPFLNLYGRL